MGLLTFPLKPQLPLTVLNTFVFASSGLVDSKRVYEVAITADSQPVLKNTREHHSFNCSDDIVNLLVAQIQILQLY